ncbi:hypothetical protein E6P09_14965 [Haloferax mediterranei ATCC 33500]|uniref:TM2 domain-containing protein n=1 Tax=Haloferax mediterranei (strain ATCC 33500 / DSM 1411 / JCM 8866 / NBRC 14739 / NCIMB 2177 / R-4) TaxID=523841 RepID=I3R740_HALMT|nr:hypothetical protein [Haloferax mediterranei]AFK20050.1 hypothetical protein HFX_2364 [Haloferax mediterranei ATCC 33500]AHZ23427.1 hypothetical protein BM92_12610 [Haloferax mediterranei ATCC 33500]ELZ99598.1 hypothetical protein C439_13629 [Haloferax mediterranei ATCC 33500]MDX5987198.1 hypothetical protein [Haloferax mediterranei ATCC 33500]QCQ76504.1 hypothetical protein E6P09_14965 [Haloferax mediterranei ATCC 33500]
MSETQESFFTRGNLFLIAVVTLGVILPGVARWYLGNAGYTNLGMIVFALGYAGMVFIVWFGWIRPLDITGPKEQNP